MAAGTWTFYNEAKFYLGAADIDLNGHTFKMALFTSASNAATATLSIYSQLTNEVTGTGYTAAGATLTSVLWSVGTSAGQYKWTAANQSWTAGAGGIANVKHAVILDNSSGASAGARKLMVHVALSTGQFTVADGNTLQINAPSAGIFTLA